MSGHMSVGRLGVCSWKCVPVDGPIFYDAFRDSVTGSRCVFGAVHISASMALPLLCWTGVSSIGRMATHPRVWLMMVVQPVSTVFIGAMLTFIRGSQWTDMFSLHLPCTLHLFGVMFTLLGLCVSFGVSQPVGRDLNLGLD